MNTNRLLEISAELGFKELSNKLDKIIITQNISDCPLILPLVGEFSSGKTTLINALTDSKALESATKPTTATIFQVHFGADKCRATVVDSQGNSKDITDIGSLKNSKLTDTSFVSVYDTSTQVPSSIVLVDTPGLSSPDPRHKQTLVNFLPQADALLLVVDINTQLTRSLIEFVKMMSLSNKRMYLVLTKADTKSAEEIANTRQYLKSELHIDSDKIVCVSAQDGKTEELISLLGAIQKDKNKILREVNEQRIKGIAKEMLTRIDELLKVPATDSGIQELIINKKKELSEIKHKIADAIDSSEEKIEAIQRNISRKFEDSVTSRLEAIAAEKCNDFDSEALSAVNGMASLALNEYRMSVNKILHSQTLSSIEDTGIDLSGIDNIDMSKLNISGLSYNLDLNTAGHEYDRYISNGLKVAAAVGIVVATAGLAAPEAAAVGTAEAAGAVGTAAETAGAVTTVAEVASDATSIVLSSKLIKAMNKAQKVEKAYEQVDKTEQAISKKNNSNGLVTSMVGFVTDKTMGKPQRRKAVHNYVDNTLMPQFNIELQKLTVSLVGNIEQAFNAGAKQTLDEMSDALAKLRETLRNKETEYNNHISKLKEYKKELEQI